jgi:hypothetical protein
VLTLDVDRYHFAANYGSLAPSNETFVGPNISFQLCSTENAEIAETRRQWPDLIDSHLGILCAWLQPIEAVVEFEPMAIDFVFDRSHRLSAVELEQQDRFE